MGKEGMRDGWERSRVVRGCGRGERGCRWVAEGCKGLDHKGWRAGRVAWGMIGGLGSFFE